MKIIWNSNFIVYKEGLIVTQSHALFMLLFMFGSSSPLQLQRWMLATEIKWSTKPSVFALWPFMGLFLWFSQLLKNLKTVLGSQVIQKTGSSPDLAHGPQFANPWAIEDCFWERWLSTLERHAQNAYGMSRKCPIGSGINGSGVLKRKLG